jgi:tellurite resistance protein
LPAEASQGLPRDPELARQYIDIVAMLQQKTRGNLSAEEDKAIQRLITDLRLAFVEHTKR